MPLPCGIELVMVEMYPCGMDVLVYTAFCVSCIDRLKGIWQVIAVPEIRMGGTKVYIIYIMGHLDTG